MLPSTKVLQGFLRLVNYYQLYILTMHKAKAPLKGLLKIKVLNDIGETHLISSDVLTSDSYNTHFDSKLEVMLGSDTSEYELETVLLHKEKNGR